MSKPILRLKRKKKEWDGSGFIAWVGLDYKPLWTRLPVRWRCVWDGPGVMRLDMDRQNIHMVAEQHATISGVALFNEDEETLCWLWGPYHTNTGEHTEVNMLTIDFKLTN